jgi:hypothetical protein
VRLEAADGGDEVMDEQGIFLKLEGRLHLLEEEP